MLTLMFAKENKILVFKFKIFTFIMAVIVIPASVQMSMYQNPELYLFRYIFHWSLFFVIFELLW